MRTSNFNFASFLHWMVITLCGSGALAVCFVVLVDPYGLYGIVNRPNLNSVKPGLTRYHHEIKLVHAVKYQPTGIVLGNSRAEIGFDPDASVFGEHASKIYNLAIPGSGIRTARLQLEFLRDADVRPSTVLMGVEFLDFVVAHSKNSLSLARLQQADDRHLPSMEFWQFDSLFSLASVKDAVRTLRIQRNDEAQTMSPNGFNPFKEYRAVARNDGYYVMFRQRAEENARTYLRKASGSFKPQEFMHLRAILDISAGAGADVKLIVYPYHAQILLLFEETGLWTTFEEWKRRLVDEVTSARRRHPNAQITLMDFSGFGYYNCERIPAKGELGSGTQWYWESGHFKKELGDILLRRVLSSSSGYAQIGITTSDAAGIFGMSLEKSNLTINKKRIATERGQCARVYPDLFTDTSDLVTKVREKLQSE